MQAAATIIIIVLLNVLLTISNGFITSGLHRTQELHAKEHRKALETLGHERHTLGAERVRLAATVAMLREAVASWEGRPERRIEETLSSTKSALEIESDAGHTVNAGTQGRPDLSEVTFLSPEEILELQQAAMLLPMEQSILLGGDAERLSKDTAWNPTGRQLDADGMQRLEELLADYRYLYKDARFETFDRYISPELAGLREAGAFATFSGSEAAPIIDGVAYTHAEITGEKGQYRLYYFFATDYPEVYHRERVMEERILETAVSIFALLND